jgi:hypothetical protein
LIFTGGPFFSFTLAPGLSERYHVPCWLDFRDAWGLGSHLRLRLSAPLVHRLEQRAVRSARLVTDVTPEMAALRRAAFADLPAGRFQVLENGFDGSPTAPSPPAAPGPALRLGIWGKFSVYHPEHPGLLLEALAGLAPATPVEIHHCGSAEEEKPLAAAAARCGLASALHFHGYQEYEAGLALLAGMDLMVVSHRSPLMVGTKVYDAIRMNQPLLALCLPEDALARMLRPFRHAYRAATGAEIAAALREVLRLRPARLDPDLDPAPYSRLSQAQGFLPLLASLLKSPAGE